MYIREQPILVANPNYRQQSPRMLGDEFVVDIPTEFSYKNIHSMIVAEILGDVADLSHNPVSKIVQSTNKIATVDQIMYTYDNLSRIYTKECIPLFVTKTLVENIVSHHTNIEHQRLDAIDTLDHKRYIVNMKVLKPLIELNDTHELFSKHFSTVHRNIKPPRKLNNHLIHLLVRKVLLIALSEADVTNLRTIPNGLECVQQFIATRQDFHGPCFNFFYKEQLLSVIEELFDPKFSIGK